MALDLSSTTGWCVGRAGAPQPHFGCWLLPKEGGEGGRYAAFENELIAALARYHPAALVLEASLSLQALASSSTLSVARQQLTLRGIAYAEAYRAAIPISEVSADIVRLAMLGQSRFAKGKVKLAVVKYCREQGHDVPDHNAGDAVLTWLWQTMAKQSVRAGSLL